MGINKSVFPSKPEKKYYKHLLSIWGSNYHIYSNLPFLSVINLENIFDLTVPSELVPIKLKKIEIERLKKTSIDYTICDPSDKPILSIEFDGLQQGFNIGSTYIAGRKNDPWRKKIMELKLKVAHGSLYPFFVMRSNHFEEFNHDDRLAIVDCVIGSILAKNKMSEMFEKGFNPREAGYSEDQFDSLTKAEQNAVVEDWAIGVEVDCYIKNSPIHRLTYELLNKLGVLRHGYGYIEDPLLVNVHDMKKRVEIIDSRRSIGCNAWVELPDGRRFNGTIWVHDFKALFFNPFSFVDELALYLALKRAQRKAGK